MMSFRLLLVSPQKVMQILNVFFAVSLNMLNDQSVSDLRRQAAHVVLL